MSYVDVEADDLEEEEELLEVVNEIVGTVSETLKDELQTEVNELRWFVNEYLPWISLYQQHPVMLYDHLYKLSIFVSLVLLSVWLLGMNHPTKKDRTPLQRTHSDPSKLETREDESSETYSNSILYETDEERFEKYYETTILYSVYRKLVLPPSCRRVANTILTTQFTQPRTPKAATQQQQQHSITDDPGARILHYLTELWVLIRSLVVYDFTSAGGRLFDWMLHFWTIRRQQQSINMDESARSLLDDSGLLQLDSSSSLVEPGGSTTTMMTVLGDDDEPTTTIPLSPIADVSMEEVDVPGGTTTTESEPAAAAATTTTTTTLLEPLTEHQNDNDHDNHLSTPTTIGAVKLSPLRSPPALVNGDHNKDVDGRDSSASPSPESLLETPELPELKPPNDNASRPLTFRALLRRKRRNSTQEAVQPQFLEDISQDDTQPFVSSSRDDQELNVDSTSEDDPLSLLNSQGKRNDGPAPLTVTTTTNPNDDSLLERSSSDGGPTSHFFDAPTSRTSLQKITVEIPMPDRHGYIVGDEFLNDCSRSTPLLVFVNSRSGPQQGHLLITQLRRLLNPIQVWDLADGGPRDIIESFLVLSRLRILVCGGDGTVSWIINTLEEMKVPRKQYPPIAILPLGTGNDLARIHGWGGGYNNESLLGILEQISESYSSLLDRWEVTIKEHKKKPIQKQFFNYLGVGADAQAALHVHHLRESRPAWFFSRLVNKAMYGVFGAEDIIKASNLHLRREIKLIADGVEVPLPPDSQGIILLNIDAYAGGVPLWSHGVNVPLASSRRTRSFAEFGTARPPMLRTRMESMDRVDSVDDFQGMLTLEERFTKVTACDRPSSCQDGYLDVVSIRGAFHLGQIKVGLSNAQRVCQCREAMITIKSPVAVQVDGEPWRQKTCKMTIKRKPDPAVMLHRSADDGGVETEMSKLLDWAEERKMIDSQVHSILMKEFSRRIESKTRQRRVRAQGDNIMSTLKKALSSGAVGDHGGISF